MQEWKTLVEHDNKLLMDNMTCISALVHSCICCFTSCLFTKWRVITRDLYNGLRLFGAKMSKDRWQRYDLVMCISGLGNDNK